jgi:hypothetical protein
MAATLLGFAVVRIVMTVWVRPHFMTPMHESTSLAATRMGFRLNSPNAVLSLHPEPLDLPNAWILSTRIVDSSGHQLTSAVFSSTCPGVGIPKPGPLNGGPTKVPEGTKDALQACVAKIGQTYHVVTTYQPANRFWLFQWYETGIYLALALLLAGASLWWIRRRLS